MPSVVDQMGRSVQVPDSPKRIVSLVPSQTELLYNLGLGNAVVGQTQFCIHPREAFAKATKIGGTKRLNLKKIRELKPDLIIGNKEENEQDQILELETAFPVWMSDIFCLKDALDMIRKVGVVAGETDLASKLADGIENRFQSLSSSIKAGQRVLYLIWRNPYMAAGRNTFIQDMLLQCGFENVIQEENSRYPELSIDNISSYKPDVVLLSSEPYPFKEKHIAELQAVLPDGKIVLVDGEMFSWYGSRLLHSPAYFYELSQRLLLP